MNGSAANRSAASGSAATCSAAKVARLAEQRTGAVGGMPGAGTGRRWHARVVDELCGLVADHPTRERLVGLC
jgi:hypothetical protein